MADRTILLVHGPNLGQLGARDPEHYGTASLDDVVEIAATAAAEHDVDIDHLQSDHEGDLLERLHAAASDGTAAVIINAGALTHYSHALRDALEILPDDLPVIEVHLSNIHAREEFRRTSVIAPACDGSIAGFGALGYRLAVEACIELLEG